MCEFSFFLYWKHPTSTSFLRFIHVMSCRLDPFQLRVTEHGTLISFQNTVFQSHNFLCHRMMMHIFECFCFRPYREFRRLFQGIRVEFFHLEFPNQISLCRVHLVLIRKSISRMWNFVIDMQRCCGYFSLLLCLQSSENKARRVERRSGYNLFIQPKAE